MFPFVSASIGVAAAVGLLFMTRKYRERHKLAHISISIGAFVISFFVSGFLINEEEADSGGKYLLWAWLAYLAYWLYANRARNTGKGKP